MAMRKSIRRELNKARELLAILLHGKTCFFCHKPFLDPTEYENKRHGAGTGEPLAVRVTVHHLNGRHHDNRPKNHALACFSCHKSYHAKIILGRWLKQKRARREKEYELGPTITNVDTIKRMMAFYTRKEAADYAASIGWPKAAPLKGNKPDGTKDRNQKDSARSRTDLLEIDERHPRHCQR